MLLLTLACGGAEPVGPGSEATSIASIAIAPSSIRLLEGQSLHLSATIRDTHGAVVTDRDVTWTVRDEGVAKVTAGGDLSGVRQGETRVVAIVGNVSDSVDVHVNLVPVAKVLLAELPDTIEVGETVQLVATAQDSAGHELAGRPIAYRSSDLHVATVSASGLVSAVAGGAVEITASIDTASATTHLFVQLPDVQLVDVAVASDVPTPARTRVARLVTAGGEATLDESAAAAATLVPQTRSQALALAVDEAGDAVLLGFVDSAATTATLSAESTADAIARLALGPFASSVSDQRAVGAAIRGAPSFQRLVDAVTRGLEAGDDLAAASEVRELALVVGSEAVPTIDAAPSMRASRIAAPRAISRTVSHAGPVETVPYTLAPSVSVPPGMSGVRLTLVSGGVNLSNFTLIPWEAWTERVDGTDLGSDRLEPPSVDLLGILTLNSLPEPVGLPGTADRFRVSIGQTKETEATAAVQAVFGALLNIMEWGTMSSAYKNDIGYNCVYAVATQIVNAKLAPLITQPTGDAAVAYLREIVDQFRPQLPSLISGCVNQDLNVATTWPTLAEAILKFMWPQSLVYQGVTAGVNTLVWIVRFSQLAEFHGDTITVDVCKENGEFARCVGFVEVRASASHVALSAAVNLTAIVMDTNHVQFEGRRVVWTSSGAGLEIVPDDDVGHAHAVGRAPGTYAVTATAGGKSDTVTVVVDEPDLFGRYPLASYFSADVDSGQTTLNRDGTWNRQHWRDGQMIYCQGVGTFNCGGGSTGVYRVIGLSEDQQYYHLVLDVITGSGNLIRNVFLYRVAVDGRRIESFTPGDCLYPTSCTFNATFQR